MKYCILIAWIFAAELVQAEMWTNAAGHAVEAELVGLDKGMVALKDARGSTFRMKLASFKKEDADRIRQRFGIKEVLPTSSIDKQLERLNQLYAAGYLAEDEYQRLCREIEKHFDKEKCSEKTATPKKEAPPTGSGQATRSKIPEENKR